MHEICQNNDVNLIKSVSDWSPYQILWLHIYPSQLNTGGGQAGHCLMDIHTVKLLALALMQFSPGLLVSCQAMPRHSVRADVGQGPISNGTLDTAALLWRLRGVSCMDVKCAARVGHRADSRTLVRFLLIQSLLTGNIFPLKTVSSKHNSYLQSLPSFDHVQEQHLP